MSEPFIAPAFIEFTRKKWALYDDEIDARNTSKEILSSKLQEKFGWSEREANVQIDKAITEWKGK